MFVGGVLGFFLDNTVPGNQGRIQGGGRGEFFVPIFRIASQ